MFEFESVFPFYTLAEQRRAYNDKVTASKIFTELDGSTVESGGYETLRRVIAGVNWRRKFPVVRLHPTNILLYPGDGYIDRLAMFAMRLLEPDRELEVQVHELDYAYLSDFIVLEEEPGETEEVDSNYTAYLWQGPNHFQQGIVSEEAAIIISAFHNGGRRGKHTPKAFIHFRQSGRLAEVRQEKGRQVTERGHYSGSLRRTASGGLLD